MPRQTKIRLSQQDISQTSTPQPKNRTTGGVTAWNNENDRFEIFVININMDQYEFPCQYIQHPSTVRLWNVEWWCKWMQKSVIQWGTRGPRDWWQSWCGSTDADSVCKCECGGFSWFAPMTQFTNAAHCTFWWGVDIVYVGCLMD